MGQCLVKTRRSAQASQLAEPFFSPPSPLPPPSSFSPFAPPLSPSPPRATSSSELLLVGLSWSDSSSVDWGSGLPTSAARYLVQGSVQAARR